MNFPTIIDPSNPFGVPAFTGYLRHARNGGHRGLKAFFPLECHFLLFNFHELMEIVLILPNQGHKARFRCIHHCGKLKIISLIFKYFSVVGEEWNIKWESESMGIPHCATCSRYFWCCMSWPRLNSPSLKYGYYEDK